MFDILAVLPQKLGAALGVPCSTTVPCERPDSRFERYQINVYMVTRP